MDKTFFTADHLHAAYGAGFTLEDISFTAAQGSLTALLGTNGSGKTTVLRSICQQMKHRGTCRLYPGHNAVAASEPLVLEQLSRRQLARQISYIPQRSGISVDTAVLDVVLMGFNPVLGLLERPSAEQRRLAVDALERLGLKGFAEKNFLCLSEGQKQLVILARTLVEDSRLLLLDEPDSALDIPNRYGIMHIIAQIVKGQPRAGILSLHDPMLALEFCDQLVLIKNGRRIGSIFPALDSLEAMEHALEQIYGPVTLAECAGKDGKKKLVLFTAARLSTP